MVDLVWSTICYQAPDLGLGRPSICFTNHYRRDRGLDIDLSVGEVVRWCGRVVGVM